MQQYRRNSYSVSSASNHKMKGKSMLNGLFTSLMRKKELFPVGSNEGELSRCLGLLDLTMLGVGSTLGLGAYVVAGSVARNTAGPAVILSFVIAAIVAVLGGISFAEFAARVPRAGSAYVYCYVTVGEGVAFLIGWNMILQVGISCAGSARGFSGYIDSLAGNMTRNTLSRAIPLPPGIFSSHVDFLALITTLLLAGILSIGIKESSLFNKIFTGINLATLAVVIISGAIFAHPSYWNIPKEKIPENIMDVGSGGFMPFGFGGVMAGVVSCFFAFYGVEAVTYAAEEAKNPGKMVPLAICFTLAIDVFVYMSVSTVLTMMLPYYSQDPNAPLPHVFDQIDQQILKWIVTIGALFAMCTGLFTEIYAMSRIVYSMADDGLIFKWLGKVARKTKTPVIATMLTSIAAGLAAAFFDFEELVTMFSTSTLLIYTIVALCVLILRYEHSDFSGSWDATPINYRQIFNLANVTTPSRLSSAISKVCIAAFTILTLFLGAVIVHSPRDIDIGNPVLLTSVIMLLLLMCLILLVLARQPQSGTKLFFRVPFVPFLPAINVIFNLILIMMSSKVTWIIVSIWTVFGIISYFCYGMRHSKENNIEEEKIHSVTESRLSVSSQKQV